MIIRLEQDMLDELLNGRSVSMYDGGWLTILPPPKAEKFHTANWTVDIDEDEPERGAFWRGASDGDMDESIFEPDENLIMDPNTFPVGTRIDVYEPEDPAFYERMFERRK